MNVKDLITKLLAEDPEATVRIGTDSCHGCARDVDEVLKDQREGENVVWVTG